MMYLYLVQIDRYFCEMLLRHHSHPSLHHTLYIHPCLRQYRAGVTTKNLFYLPGSDRRLAWQPDTDALGLVVVVEIEDEVAQELHECFAHPRRCDGVLDLEVEEGVVDEPVAVGAAD